MKVPSRRPAERARIDRRIELDWHALGLNAPDRRRSAFPGGRPRKLEFTHCGLLLPRLSYLVLTHLGR